jgi:hypothetical protein
MLAMQAPTGIELVALKGKDCVTAAFCRSTANST